MSRRKESASLGRKEGSRRATCVYIAVSGTSSLPCHAPCALFGSGHLLSGTTLAASDVSQSTPGSLYQNTCFKEPSKRQVFSCLFLSCKGGSLLMYNREDSVYIT